VKKKMYERKKNMRLQIALYWLHIVEKNFRKIFPCIVFKILRHIAKWAHEEINIFILSAHTRMLHKIWMNSLLSKGSIFRLKCHNHTHTHTNIQMKIGNNNLVRKKWISNSTHRKAECMMNKKRKFIYVCVCV
jgi:hypothetical protein